MSKKDLTQLSKKELESMLAKKYGVDKYLNQRSQLLSLLGTKGETDIQTGFTGPETEALSIIFESSPAIGSRSKAEGGIVNLFSGSDDGFSEDDDVADYSVDDSGQYTGNDDNDEDSAEADAYQTTEDYYKNVVESSPQVRGGLKDAMQKAIDEGRLQDIELEGGYGPDNKTMATGVYHQGQMPGLLGALLGSGRVYTGYGKGFEDMIRGSDDGSDSSEMIKKIVAEKKKEEDSPLSQEQIDYYTRGMGTASKPLKTLEDVNSHISSLVGPSESPTGAKLSKDKKFLILPNGKIINIMTGRVQDSMSGLELFRGGLV